MELQITKINDAVKGITNMEVRVIDENVETIFSADYTSKELEGDNWTEKAKNIYLELKEEGKDNPNFMADFNRKKNLIMNKFIDITTEEVNDGEVEK